MSRRILILFAHPAFQRSRINRHLVRAVTDLDAVTFHDLYEVYPNFMIDVPREQELLAAHDVVILQHPFFWYSSPAILKEWQDLVLTHNWAYGSEGRALEGKIALQAISTGASEEHYRPDGVNQFTIKQFLAPFAQTFALCRMTYLAPFVVHGAHQLVDEKDLLRGCDDYRQLVEALRDNRLDLDAAREVPNLKTSLTSLIQS